MHLRQHLKQRQLQLQRQLPLAWVRVVEQVLVLVLLQEVVQEVELVPEQVLWWVRLLQRVRELVLLLLQASRLPRLLLLLNRVRSQPPRHHQLQLSQVPPMQLQHPLPVNLL